MHLFARSILLQKLTRLNVTESNSGLNAAEYRPSRHLRTYLSLVGLLYVGLGLYCSFSPVAAARTVGFTLNGQAGSSEFLAVYGGLEIGMGLAFLLPLLQIRATRFALQSCLLIHCSIVICRTISLFTFTPVATSTVKLATGEWVILICGIVCCALTRNSSAK